MFTNRKLLSVNSIGVKFVTGKEIRKDETEVTRQSLLTLKFSETRC